MENELEQSIAAAIAENKCFSKGRLKAEFRMKPAPNAQPVRLYKDGFGGKFGVYLLADCVPMKKVSTSVKTDKQIKAGRMLALRSKLNSGAAGASARAVELLSEKPLFIDTETTGLGDTAEIIEIAVCDSDGVLIYSSLVRPTVTIEPEASAVNGISDADLVLMPGWDKVGNEIREILAGRAVVAFNAQFDWRLVAQSYAAVGVDAEWMKAHRVVCAMEIAVEAFGATNRHGTISLARATEAAGVEWQGEAHSAYADTRATVDLIKAIATYKQEIDAEIEALNEKTPTLKE